MAVFGVPAILGWALLCARRLPGQPGASILVAISALLCGTYGFALLGALWPGATLLFGLGWGLLVAFALRDRSELFGFVVSPACLLFLFFVVLYALRFSGAQYTYWDEFSQWGMATRELLATHALWGADANLRRATAPPGAALWQYFLCANTRGGEGDTYVAQFALLVGALVPLWDGLSPGRSRPADWLWTGLAAALAFLVVVNLGNGVVVLYVDHLLGALFAGTLLAAARMAPRPANAALLLFPLSALCLIKETGVYFSLAAAAFAVARHSGLFHESVAAALRRARTDRGGTAVLASCLAMPLLAVGSWQLHLARQERPVEPARSVWNIGAQVLPGAELESAATVHAANTRDRFWRLFREQAASRSEVSSRLNAFSWAAVPLYPDEPRLSALGWALLASGLFGIAVFAAPGGGARRTTAALGLTAVVTFAAYTLALLRVYTTSGAYGAQLSSYVRYVDTALLPLVLLSFAAFLPCVRGNVAAPRWAAALVSVVVFALYALETPWAPGFTRVPVEDAARAGLAAAADEVRGAVGPGAERLVVHFPDGPRLRNAPLLRTMLRYELTPVRTRVVEAIDDAAGVQDALGERFLWLVDTGTGAVPALLEAHVAMPLRTDVLYRVRPEGVDDGVPSLEPVAEVTLGPRPRPRRPGS